MPNIKSPIKSTKYPKLFSSLGKLLKYLPWPHKHRFERIVIPFILESLPVEYSKDPIKSTKYPKLFSSLGKLLKYLPWSHKHRFTRVIIPFILESLPVEYSKDPIKSAIMGCTKCKKTSIMTVEGEIVSMEPKYRWLAWTEVVNA